MINFGLTLIQSTLVYRQIVIWKWKSAEDFGLASILILANERSNIPKAGDILTEYLLRQEVRMRSRGLV